MKNNKTAPFNKASFSGDRWDEDGRRQPERIPVDDPRNDITRQITPDLIQVPTQTEYERNNTRIRELERSGIVGNRPAPAKPPKRPLPN